MNHALEHHYRGYRDHQRDIMTSNGGSMTVYPSGRIELSYGSAPYGEHALSALASARRTIAFRKSLRMDVKQHNKRSAAAKRGWRTRRAQ